jgi:carbon-monoxide dehydrogenase large subunit
VTDVADLGSVGVRNVGARVFRSEDPRILTGRGRYIDDLVLPGMLHAAFMRSTVPHGRLLSVDVSEARALPGVIAVYTGADMAERSTIGTPGGTIGMNQMPGMKVPSFYSLATDKVRYVGDPIAMVVAESRAIAEDAVELIVEDIDWLDPVMTYDQAFDPSSPVIFEELGDNVALTGELMIGDIDAAFAKADRVISASLSVHRHQPVPMECRGSVADWDGANEQLTFHTATQSPHMVRLLLPAQIGVPMEKIRTLSEDVGGGFGLKNGVFREDVAISVASIDLGRPVKWIEDRAEHLATGGQAREEKADIEAAVTDDGVLLGVRMEVVLNQGAYPIDPFPGAIMAGAISSSFQGPSKLEAIAAHNRAVFSNKGTYVSYRGPWATGDFLRERMLDIVARELDLDPLDVRRRNYIHRGEPPLNMLTGQPYTGVTTQEAIEQAARIVGWDDFKVAQQAARDEGRYLGLGLASYLEAAPGPRNPATGQSAAGMLGNETSHVSIERDGSVTVITQQHPHGQGTQTTLAQVAADELGVPFDQITVKYGDTDITPFALVSTGGSRAATMANGSVLFSSRALREKIVSIASELLEAAPEDLELRDGAVNVKGTPSISLSFSELARIVADEPERLPDGVDAELTASEVYDGGEGGWSGGTHCCFVEVDVETGFVEILRYVVVEDCGLPVNPAIVEGQVRGGVAQAIGAVLLEQSAYGEDGQFLAGTFMDYLLPSTTTVPNFEIHHVETVLNDPDVNFRGVGEGGMIVAPAAIVNAIENALEPFGAQIREQHLPPARILEIIGVVPSG